jgi:hypothetical protein
MSLLRTSMRPDDLQLSVPVTSIPIAFTGLRTRLISILIASAFPAFAAGQELAPSIQVAGPPQAAVAPAPAKLAQGQAAPLATTVDALTVTAPKREAAELRAMVSRFVEAHGEPSRIDQLSRWAIPICPTTGGLSAPLNGFVTARVVQVAASVGVPVAKPRNRNVPCKTNVLIVFTATPQKLLDNVRRDHSQMLGFHYAAQTQRLATFDHPIQAWYLTGTGGLNDNPEPDTEFGYMPGGTAGSRLTAKLTNQFMGVLVVVDATQAVGRQIGPIADHVAMLALARGTHLAGCSELPSILDFMNPDCHVKTELTEMTVYDAAYLRGLYSINPEEYLAAQRGEIGSRMIRELTAHSDRPPLLSSKH